MDRTLRYRWWIFGVLLAAYFLVYLHRVIDASVARPIVEDIGVFDVTTSMALLASVYLYAYLVMQIPSGLMTDRIGPRKITFAFLLLAALGTFLTSFGHSFAAIIIGKILIACGMAVVYIPLTKILAVWFRKKDFATLNGSIIAVGNVGAIAAGAPIAWIIGSFGWRDTFFALGVITLILALLCLLVVRNRPSEIGEREILDIYPEDRQDHETYEKVPLKSGLITTAKSGRAFWMPATAYLLIYGTIMVYQGLWVKTYFEEIYAFASAALLISIIGVGKIISAALAGTVANMVGSKRTVMLTANLGYLVIWGIIWLMAGEINMFWFWMGINFMFGLFSGFMVLAFAQAKDWFPVSISGTVIAMVNVMIFSGGAVFTTLSGFVLSDMMSLSDFSTLWGIMFFAVAGACLMAFLSRDNNTGSVMEIKEAKPKRDRYDI
ncbi:MAG: MFS transporter [Methanomassiliicoccaceae archaeon]|nr:MFS transporter [Methanomassiliicoccaceae archaeon]